MTLGVFNHPIKAIRCAAHASVLACGLAACSTVPDPGSASVPALASVASLDQARYLGGWYEIAKYPNWFQRNCVSDTKATYRALPEGGIQVVNRCRTKSGDMDQAVGVARSTGSGDSSQLQVTFAPKWLWFLGFIWADYWVIDIDPGYQLVAVSEPRRKYLWILSRTPSVDDKTLAALVERLKLQGFDTSKLDRTPQLD